jgi:AAA15 family ATPase/GTPase
MLVEFQMKNYRCFKDEQVLSLNASSDQTLSDNIIVTPASAKMKLLRCVVI